VDSLPVGAEWAYELKLDGYRALILKDGSDVQIRSRNDKTLTSTHPRVAAAGERLAAESATVDGEIVASTRTADPPSRPVSTEAARKREESFFYAFDLLHLKRE
jgi:bifunctional non-homologous end joining protein LigD